jgi:YegS/Rv2252/BmrU family lipid kinase
MTDGKQPRNNPAPSVEVIINADSGASGNEAARERLVELFGASGIQARIWLAKSGDDLLELARRAVRGEAATIVAGGGDGTINAVASTLIDTEKTLGILPLGTLNHFAKDLKIPLDLEGAARTIIAGHAVHVDAGEVNGRTFLNNSSLGLYPSIVDQREQKQKLGHGKWPAFVWAALGVMRRYPFLDVRLNAGGKEFSSRTPFVFIGNNEYQMEGFNIGGRDRLDEGQLSLYFSHRTGRFGLLGLGLRALLRRLPKAGDFIAMCTTEVSIKTRRRRIRVSTDGEVTTMQPPLRYRVRPGALRVHVPVPALPGDEVKV